MTDKQKYIALFAGFAIILMIMFALAPKRMSQEEYYQQVPKATNPRDFYLVYKYYFDPELIRLRKEIEHHEMVRNKEVGQDKGL